MSNIRTHYDNLKVARNAPPEVIRAAYKALIQKYHPDKNPDDAGAARIMHIINSSYEVLSDPQRRSAHDAWIADLEREVQEKKERRWRKGASGPSPESQSELEHRLAEEEKERRRLERLLALERQRSVEYYATRPVSDINGSRRSRRWLRIVGLCAPFVVVGVLLILAYKAGKVDAGFRKLSRGIPRLAASLSCPKETPPAAGVHSAGRDGTTFRRGGYIRPVLAPNGLPWPKQAGYLQGSKVAAENGRSQLSIDNSRNGSDVLARLVIIAAPQNGAAASEAAGLPKWQSPEDTRVLFIPAGGSFTLEKIDPGTYAVRYLDLEQGVEWSSDSIGISQTAADTVSSGYSRVSMVLYRGQREPHKPLSGRGGSLAQSGATAANQRDEVRPLWSLINRIFFTSQTASQ